MTTIEADPIKIEQPVGGPLVVEPEQVEVFKEAAAVVDAEGGPKIPEHHLAAAVIQTAGERLSDEEIADIARSWSEVERLLKKGNGTPVIFDDFEHDAKAVAMAGPSAGALSYRYGEDGEPVNANPLYLTIPTQRLFTAELSSDDGADKSEEYTEGVALDTYSPFSVLTSDRLGDARDFLAGEATLHNIPHSRLVVGSKAVEAYLRVQVDEEVKEVDMYSFNNGTVGFSHSYALLHLAALKNLGYEPHIGQTRGSVIHKAGMDVLASMIVSGLTDGYDLLREHDEDEKIMRRVPALNLTSADVQALTAAAAKLLGENKDNAISAYAAKNGGDMEAYLGDAARSFLQNVLNVGWK